MPSIVSCEPRSPPASPVQSPPRKKFKFSLKLKPKKKAHTKLARNDVTQDEVGEKNEDFPQNDQEETLEEPTENGTSTSDTLPSTSLTPETDSTERVIPPLPFAGLANLGNTCYLNAVLQVLRYCPEFSCSMANLDDIYRQEGTTTTGTADSGGENDEITDKNVQLRPNIIHSVHKLTCEMNNAEENYNKLGMEAEEVKNRSGYTTLAVHPKNFVKEFSALRPMFCGYQQHDAQEFLRSFLSLIEEYCNGLTKDGTPKDHAKENIITSNTNESKVRGGCKYPQHKDDVLTSTIAEPTSMTLTSDNPRTVVDCPEDESNLEPPCLNKTAVSKAHQKDHGCQECSAPDDFNLIKRLFEGTLQLQTCCLNCEGVRKRYENFQDISVPVQNSKHNFLNNAEDVLALSDSEDENEKDVTLSWAISRFASVERLQGENKYFCDSCATLTEAEISTYFEKLPRVLTIHLKRFQTSYGPSFYTSSLVAKVTKSLHTPQQLSLTRWCSKTCSNRTAVYKLFGVVMHSGMSSCSGHYLSYVKVDIANEQRDTKSVQYSRACNCRKDETEEKNSSCPLTDNESTPMETDSCIIKENTESDFQDVSVEKQPPTGITKYFQPIRKNKNSSQGRRGNEEHLSCQESCSCQINATSSTEVEGEEGSSRQQTEFKLDGTITMPANEDCSGTPDPDDLSSPNGKWLKFDDAEVQEMGEKDMDDILSPSSSCYSTPYLLFYFRS